MDDSDESDIIFFKWTNSCRLCLAPNAEIDIFTNDSTEIFQCIQSCFHTLIYKGDPLPRKICPPCKQTLIQLNEFRKSCLKIEQDIKRRLLPYCKIDYVQTYFDKCGRHNENSVSPSLRSDIKPTDILKKEEFQVESVLSKPEDLKPIINDSGLELSRHCTSPVAETENLDSLGKIISVTGTASVLWEENSLNFKTSVEVSSLEHSTLKRVQTNATRDSSNVDVPVVAIKQEDGTVMCSRCSEVHQDILDFEHHLCTLQVFDCHICQKTFNHSWQLEKHICSLTEEYCSSPLNRLDLNFLPIIKKEICDDSQVKTVITPWKCPICHLYLQSKKKLKQHLSIARCHTSKSKLNKCNYCFRSFVQSSELWQHHLVHLKVLLHLTDDDLVCCPDCGLQFPNLTRLNYHRQVHVRESKTVLKFVPKPSHHVSLKSCHNKSKTAVETGRCACNECGQMFSTQSNLGRHKKTHHFKKESSETDSAELTIATTDGTRPQVSFRCRMCGIIFNSGIELKKHSLDKHKNSTPFVCRKCPQRFATRTLLLIHLRGHMPKTETENQEEVETKEPEIDVVSVETVKEQPKVSKKRTACYKCPLCALTSFSAHNINLHIKAKHPRSKLHAVSLRQQSLKTRTNENKCMVCSESFHSINALNAHVIHYHRIGGKPKSLSTHISALSKNATSSNGKALETCPFCFKQVTDSKSHIKKNHKGEKADPALLSKLGMKISANRALVCRFCYKTFSSAYNRRLHETIHSVRKTQWYNCKVCQKRFFNRSLYDHHRKMHVSESFHCDKCYKIFFKESSFYQHICPHDTQPGRKQFRCPKCPRSYDTLKSLKHHISVSHKDKPFTPETSEPVPLPAASSSIKELWKEESNKIVCRVGDKYYCSYHDVEFSTLEECKQHEVLHPRGNWYVIQLTDVLFQCTVCNDTFHFDQVELHIDLHKSSDNEADLISPRKTTLGMKRTFKCPFCNIAYSTESNLQNHIFYVHPEVPNKPMKK